MDFFGFHPLYVVILVALALLIFGPSRLPKMGAQMGRMLREFQAARDGLTQQMRDAFEEEPETNFAASSTPVEDEDEDTETASEEGAVAVLDPPPGGQTTPEALGTAAGTEDGSSEDVNLGDAAAAGVTAALQTPEEGAGAQQPAEATPAEATPGDEPVTAAAPSTPAEEAEAAAASSTPAAEATAAEPEPAAVETGDSEPHREGAGAAESEASAAVTSDVVEARTEAEEPPASAESEAGPVTDRPDAEAVAAHHDAVERPHDEESRAD